jgi:hypothetical protein
MVGRDNPRVVTRSGIRGLLGDTETLKAIGYESGDFTPLVYVASTGNESTSSTTYVDALGAGWLTFSWDDTAPTGGDLYVWFYGKADVNNNELSVKIRDTTSDKDMAERTGIDSDGLFKIAPTKYEPTIKTSPIEIRTEIKSSDGSQVRVFIGSPVLGIQI